MKIKTYFNFFEGKTAKFLKERRGISFDSINNVEIKDIKGLSESDIMERGNHFFFLDGENEYLMFEYLKRAKVIEYGLPKYHTVFCITRKKFKGYVYANKMPVDITETTNGEIHKDCKLNMCGNCKTEISKSFWNWGDLDWYDAVLNYVEDDNNKLYFKKSGKRKGYLRMWEQVSEAYRESKKWTCEKCKVKLYDDKYYLHVHHINGNIRDNRRKNFQSLCLLCHALEHKNKIDNFTEVHGFIQKYSKNLNKRKINEFENI